MEGEAESEAQFTDIVIPPDAGIDASLVYHVVVDVLGFVLFMHQQIPSIFQDLCLDFDALHAEYKELERVLAQTEMKASERRNHAGRKREVKHCIKRLEKLMKTVSSVRAAIQTVFSEIPNIKSVLLILGASPIRPQHVYELCFSHGSAVVSGVCDFSKSRTAEAISRKAIRALISKGAGSDSYAGPTKLFLLVKAQASFNLPLHFLPKRDFRYNKKIMPLRLRVKCKARANTQDYDSRHSSHLMDSTSNDWIWFQCRHIIKGLACKTPAEE